MNNNSFTLSFDEGRPVARIEGGDYNGQIVLVADTLEEDKKLKQANNDHELLMRSFFRDLRSSLSLSDLSKIMRAIKAEERPIDPELAKIYDLGMEKLHGFIGRELMVREGSKIQQICNPNMDREVLYITGMSDSGKSYKAAEYCESYHVFFPDNPIYLISAKLADPVFDELEYVERLALAEIVGESTKEDFANSLVIFDDMEELSDEPELNIKGSELERKINRLRDAMLKQSRSLRTYVIVTSHLACEHKKTKTVLNEFTSISLFPGFHAPGLYKYLLERYVGLKAPQIEKLWGLPTRSVTLTKTPWTVIYDRGVYLI